MTQRQKQQRRQTLKNLVAKIRPFDRQKAKQDWHNFRLKVEQCGPFSPMERTGLHTLDEFFFKHRIRAAGKSGWTFPEALANNKTRKYLEQKLTKIRGKTLKNGNTDYEQQMYHIFQLYYGAVNQFRPSEAARIICKMEPKQGILDFSSGWGGRLLAAMAYKIPYYGCDANKELQTSYKSLVDFCEVPEHMVKMTFKPTETVEIDEITGGKPYDLIFTSPPYFTLEKYRGMPDYENREAFLKDFLGVVVSRAWQGLSHGGNMAINMPKFMYDWIVKNSEKLGILPETAGRASQKIKLAVKSRHGRNASHGRTPGTTEQKRYEWVYIWKKD
jgi:hypothetical protein